MEQEPTQQAPMQQAPMQRPPMPPDTFKPRLWVPGDWNAFFGLGTNVLLNVLVLSSLVLFVIKLPNDIVFGRILPALGIALPIGNLYYAYLAYRLGRKEGRDDVAAMPYGPSVPHYFFVTFVIMLPVVIKTNGDVLKAWEAGLAWAFFIGVVVLIGAFIGPTIRRYTPRAAMLGTLAGISVAFISMSAAFEMWNAAWIALATFAIVLLSWTAGVRLPFGIPGGLAAIIVGTIIGWLSYFVFGWHGLDPKAVGQIATHSVGTGPFAFKSFTPNYSVELTRNRYYWGPKTNVSGVVFRYFANANSENGALQSGQINVIDNALNPQDIGAFKGNPKYKIIAGPTNGKIQVTINNKSSPLANTLVRQAIAYATDKKAIIQTAGGYGVAIGSAAIDAYADFPSVAPQPARSSSPGRGRRGSSTSSRPARPSF